MKKLNVTVGQIINNCIVLKIIPPIAVGLSSRVEVRCNECGIIKTIIPYRINCTHKAREYHGLSKHPLFRIYWNMIQSCYNPAHRNYKKENGVCDSWHNGSIEDGFATFCADMGPRPAGTDLIHVGQFCKQNCSWGIRGRLTPHNTKMLTHNGISDSVSGWARRLGMKKQTLSQRLLAGWTLDRALRQTLGVSV